MSPIYLAYLGSVGLPAVYWEKAMEATSREAWGAPRGRPRRR